MHKTIILSVSREASKSSVHSFLRLYSTIRLALLTSDQLTIELILHLTLVKLHRLYSNGIYSSTQYHGFISQLLMLIRHSSLPSSGMRDLMKTVLKFSSKVMLAQSEYKAKSAAGLPASESVSINATLTHLIGAHGCQQVDQILGASYIA